MQVTLELCFVSVFFLIVNHGGRRVNTAQALAQWGHLVALHEATDELHQAMRPTSHRSVSHVFFVIVDFVACHKHKLKTMLWL
jgi:hypothetical protein